MQRISPPMPSAVFFRRLMAGVLAANLFILVLGAWWLNHSRTQDIEASRTAAQNLVRVLDQYVVSTVRNADLALLTVVDEYRRYATAGGVDAEALNRLLAQQQSRLPELESLRIADAQGRVRYGLGVTPATQVNVSDRDYFVAARDGAPRALVISKPLFARISKKWVIVFARRLDRADGSFGGVVYVNLALEHVTRSFAALDVGPQGTLTLRDDELGVVARHPEPMGPGSTIGNKAVSGEFREMIAAGKTAGTFTVRAGLDNVERVFAYRKTGPYPLYVIVGLAVDDTLAEWRREVVGVGILAAVFLAMALLFSRLLLDVWKRQLAAAEGLRRQEEKFHTVADFTYDWEYWLGADHREILYMTPSCERVTGYAAAEFAADPDLLYRIVHADDRRLMDTHLRHYGDHEAATLDFRIVRRDGELRWIAHACRPVFGPAGEFRGRRVANRDVTDRKRVEQALREAEARFRSSFDSAAIGMALVTPEGRFAEVNAALCQIVGYAPEELKQKTFQEITHAEDLAADLAYSRQLAAGERPSYHIEKRYLHKDGHFVWILLTGSAVRDDKGGLLYFVAQMQDITERKQAEETLKRSEQRLREAQRIAQIGSWELDLTNDTLTWSDEVFRIFEIDASEFDASYEAFLNLIHPEDRESVNLTYTSAVRNHLPYEMTHRLAMSDGNIKYVHEHCETVYAADGKPLRSLGTVQDVTLTVLNEQAMRESEERFRTIADYTYDWEYWQGTQGEFLYISPSCQRVTGYTQGDFISNPGLVYDIIHVDDRHLMEEHIADIRHEDEGSLDYRIVRKDGGIRWIAHGCRAVYAKDGRFLGRRASNRDVTDRKTVEDQVQQLAYFDTLTGLPNRRLLFDRLERALTQAKRFERSLAIMFLDLDNFKKINDTLGHDAGDDLLKEVAVRLGTCVRSGDTVARQGGDEFIVVLAEIAEPRDAALVAEKIVAVLGGTPVRVAGQDLRVTTSIGIAVYPVNGSDDVQELLKKADKAMYEAKAGGRNGFRFFAAD